MNTQPYGYDGNQNNPGFSPYGAYDPWQFDARRREKKALRFQGLLGGGALLCSIGVQYVVVFLLMALGVYEKYAANPLFQSGADIIIVLLSILLPFALFGKGLQKRTGIEESLPLSAPFRKDLFFLAIPAGLALCMIANIATSYLTAIISAFGVELSSPDIAMPEGALGILTSFCRVAIVAAVVEELAFRGFIMQNLRPFGDGFAIVMSAFVFAFMHGNLIQAPFALIAGCALGYFAVKTGSLWTSIIIHALNNSCSLLISYLGEDMEVEALARVSGVILYGLILLGLPCLVIFIRKAKSGAPAAQRRTLLSGAEKAFAYLSSPTMIIAIIIMLYTTSKFISLG